MQVGTITAKTQSRVDDSTHTVDWSEIFKRLSVYFMSSFSMSEPDASDAAQTVIVRLLKAEPRRDPTKPLLPWCYRIARNYGIDCHRKRIREPEVARVSGDEIPGNEAYDPQTGLDRSELKKVVAGFVERLSDADREIAYLRYYEDLKFDEIATITGRATGTIRYRAFTIRRRLRSFLEEVGWHE